MIEIIATVESVYQATEILPSVDTIIFGEEKFGLRLPYSFSKSEQKELVALAHEAGKQVMVAVNGIIHPDKMKDIPKYLRFLKSIHVDKISLGDPGIIFVMQQQPELALPFIYDGQTLVTSARQVNFWGRKGANGAVLAREVPFIEMKEMAVHLNIPTEVLVYGATCIHHSKRSLLQNYFHYTKQDEVEDKSQNLFLSEEKREKTHYSIYEDNHGTHIFASDDICLMNELPELAANGYQTWKLDGIFTTGQNFVEIIQLYDTVRKEIEKNTYTTRQIAHYASRVNQLHPVHRTLSTGFYDIDPEKIK
ncbi:MAG: U32 family peptidase [Tetragenococcus halophilus]|nr:U32 family peptidase [Tetragenococcus halophilus]